MAEGESDEVALKYLKRQLLSSGEIIRFEDLPEEVKQYDEDSIQKGIIFAENLVGLTLREIEKQVIKASLIKNGGRRAQTANMLGISDKGLRNKIAEYGIYE